MAADHLLFVGWNRAVDGKEHTGVELFNQFLGFFATAQMTGRIESYEPIILDPHGGDLNYFFLVRATPDKLNALRGAEDFLLIVTKATAFLAGFGIVHGLTTAGTKLALSRMVMALGPKVA